MTRLRKRACRCAEPRLKCRYLTRPPAIVGYRCCVVATAFLRWGCKGGQGRIRKCLLLVSVPCRCRRRRSRVISGLDSVAYRDVVDGREVFGRPIAGGRWGPWWTSRGTKTLVGAMLECKVLLMPTINSALESPPAGVRAPSESAWWGGRAATPSSKKASDFVTFGRLQDLTTNLTIRRKSVRSLQPQPREQQTIHPEATPVPCQLASLRHPSRCERILNFTSGSTWAARSAPILTMGFTTGFVCRHTAHNSL